MPPIVADQHTSRRVLVVNNDGVHRNAIVVPILGQCTPVVPKNKDELASMLGDDMLVASLCLAILDFDLGAWASNAYPDGLAIAAALRDCGPRRLQLLLLTNYSKHPTIRQRQHTVRFHLSDFSAFTPTRLRDDVQRLLQECENHG